MRDLKLIDPSSPRIPDEWRGKYLARPVEPKDVTELFDRQHALSKEKDKLQADLIRTTWKADLALNKIWVLTLVAIAELAAIVSLALTRIH